MGLSNALTERLEEELSGHTRQPAKVTSLGPVGGGSINDCYRIEGPAGRFFVKVNSADRFPSLFEAEADGLNRLNEAGPIRTPGVIAYGEVGGDAYLLLEWIEQGLASDAGWRRFGAEVAALHQHTAEAFGLQRDNYIGSLKQVNTPRERWSDFLVDCRLEPLTRMARDRGALGMGEAFRFERLYGRLHDLFPAERPALLHGDLWSGNRMFASDGLPVLIDPAVYYGHREMDLGMALLFGGFEPGFFATYHEQHPLEAGWEERVPLTQLYPLLVHTVLFGGGYAKQVRTILERFT